MYTIYPFGWAQCTDGGIITTAAIVVVITIITITVIVIADVVGAHITHARDGARTFASARVYVRNITVYALCVHTKSINR